MFGFFPERFLLTFNSVSLHSNSPPPFSPEKEKGMRVICSCSYENTDKGWFCSRDSGRNSPIISSLSEESEEEKKKC